MTTKESKKKYGRLKKKLKLISFTKCNNLLKKNIKKFAYLSGSLKILL